MDKHRSNVACSVCGEAHTHLSLPADGYYICGRCAVERQKSAGLRKFPPGTFRCCPTATEEGAGGVVRCTSCKGWYHCKCLNITEPSLRAFLSLSTTKWYCQEPSCCEKVLRAHVKKEVAAK